MAANATKTSLSLAEAKAEKDRGANLDKQFNKVEEFDEIKHEIDPDVTIIGVASTSQKKLINSGEASIYFYPTGEKDGALVFFSTIEEFAYLEIEPFLSDVNEVFQPIEASVAKLEDILQTKMDTPNLKTKRIWVTELNRFITVKLTARALKTVTKNGAFATLKKAGIV